MEVAPHYTLLTLLTPSTLFILLTLFTLFTLYTVNTVYTIQTALHCLNNSMYAYIILLKRVRMLLEWASEVLSKMLIG